ncbi:MAG: NADPH-dependent oxidoreductase [Proteobacteria bacterium]|nr:MAG: NADPH-dependent oxidoreductase [Pseudomonadota bacterium]
MANILAFAGSTRSNSFNFLLLRAAVASAKHAGAEVTMIDLGDYSMPLFDQDLEAAEGMPENAQRLKQLMIEHEGLLVASPEYNSSISPLLKNTVDWVSRSASADEPALAAYRNKFAAIMSASPGGLGGLRGLVVLRMLLTNIGVTVLPQQLAVGHAHSAFDDDGTLRDVTQQDILNSMTERLVSVIDAINR